MSVDVESMLIANGLDSNFSLRRWPDNFLVCLQAGFVREKNQIVEHRPWPADQLDNPYHAEVIGNKTSATCNAFRDAAKWVKKPDGVD
jgi:hypothetical protein